MKKIITLFTGLLLLTMLVSAFPVSAENTFDEPLDTYDDYGYYASFDFENYGSSTKHLNYMQNSTATNADGKLCDPFGFLMQTGNAIGTGTLVKESNGNHYYSFVQNQTDTGDYGVIGVFAFQTNTSAKNCIITEAAEISFRIRMHTTQPVDNAGKRMPLIHLHRGANGANNNAEYVSIDNAGNIYAYVNGATKQVYTNTDSTKFIDVSLVWYDATNTYSLYVNDTLVVEAMQLKNNYRDASNVSVSFSDDFLVSSRALIGDLRSMEICRGNSTKFGFDIDDISLKRVETAQRGRVYYSNSFDALYEGVTVRKGSNSNVYRYTNGSETNIALAEVSDSNKALRVASGSSFALADDHYQLFTQNNLVIEARIKAKPTHSNTVENGETKIVYKSLIALHDKINWFGMLYVDPDGNLYLEGNKPKTLIGGYKLDGENWLDITAVLIKNNDNAGKFGTFKSGTNTSGKNTVYSIAYYINGDYVGSTGEQVFYEWKKTSTDSATGISSGYTSNNRKISISYTEVTGTENSPLDLTNLEIVANGVTPLDSKGNGIYSDTNHIIYKSEDGLVYYDVEYDTDGTTQLRYSTMTVEASADANVHDTITFFAGVTFEGMIDDIKVYEGTSPEWYYENINSVKGGDILNADFGKLAASGGNAKAQTSIGTDTDILGIFRSGEFLNSKLVRKTAAGVAVTAEAKNVTQADYSTFTLKTNSGGGDWFDFFVPVPAKKDGVIEAEYSFEITMKNINITEGSSAYSGQFHLFRQRIEDEYDNNGTTKVKAFTSGDLLSIDAELKLWGGNYLAVGNDERFALCDVNGNQIVLDNNNWNTVRADVYCLKGNGNNYFAISYYYNGKRLYLEDGSVAYRVEDSRVTQVLADHWGQPNHRVRISQALGGDSITLDVKSIKINANNVEKPVYNAPDGVQASVNNKVSVFELEVPKYTNANTDNFYSAVSLNEDTAADGLVFVDVKNETLAVRNGKKYYTLCDKDGISITLGDKAPVVAVVYDDINGTARYYVNGTFAYIKNGTELAPAVELDSTSSLKAALESGYALFKGFECDRSFIKADDYKLSVSNINDRDTAEVIGYQESTIENGIRIIAGVDSLYYSNVGFEVKIFENGELKKDYDVKDNLVFDSVIADGETITAGSKGYKYLATLNVDNLPKTIPENSYLLIRSYTDVAGNKHYDREAKLAVSEDGYAFVQISDKDIYNKKQAVLLIGQSNMAGRGDLATVEAISDDRITMMRNLEWVPMAEPIHNDKSIAGAGIAASFAKAFVENFDCELGLIPAAVGGTSLAQWTKGYSGDSDFDLYEKALAMAKEAQKDSEICAILWHQGCSDTKNSQYAEKFKVILDDFIADLGLDPEKIIIISGELAPQKGTNADLVNNALASLVDDYDNYAVATTENLLTLDENTHFDAPSLRVLGYRYFAHFYKFVTGKTYEFVDDIEHYRVIPEEDETVDTNLYVADVSFDNLTAGTSYTETALAGNLDFRPNGNSVSVVANGVDANDKYIGINWTKGKTPPFVDVTTPYAKGNIVVTEVKFMMNDGFCASGPMLKLVQLKPSVSSIHLIRVGLDGTLYNTNGTGTGAALVNPETGSAYTLDRFEWTTVKVVCDLAKNTKDIYIDGTLCLDNAALASSVDESSSFVTASTRIMQYDPYTGNEDRSGTIFVEDFKSYHLPIANVDFENFETQSITSVITLNGVSFSATASKTPMAIVESSDNKYASISSIVSSNSNGFMDISTASVAGRDLTVEGKFKIGKYIGNAFAAKGNLFKLLDANSTTIALVGLAADGSLHDYVYTTDNLYPSVGESLGVTLSETEWTTVKVVCHFATNTKDIYINGTLVKEGVALYRTDKYSAYTPAVMRIMHFGGSGIGTLFVDDYKAYN